MSTVATGLSPPSSLSSLSLSDAIAQTQQAAVSAGDATENIVVALITAIADFGATVQPDEYYA